ncbi:DoxX family protein [Actinomadura graeca]|uniref:DoxX family protein n=1 Tax=Actinomadura graeca TaxID=2750812 RepID=A0ABX8QMS6_9ACTN|nr:DoxX family protein [Actinomadura graeca]QXJ19785.1 DoxX family protein [Actinomadura graeca]
MSTNHSVTADTTADTATAARLSTRRKVLWGAQILLGVFLFFVSAMPKLAGQSDAVESFARIGWGQWFRYVTGVVEAAGAVGLVVPRLAGVAATGLIGVMAGAVLAQLLALDPPLAVVPAVLALVFAAIAWDRRPETRGLLRALRR